MFTFCKRVRFEAPGGLLRASRARVVAEDPVRWGETLLAAKTRCLRLHHRGPSDPRASGPMSANLLGGRWLIEAMRDKDSDVWEAHWRRGDERHPAQRGWLVEYRRIESRRAHLPFQPRGLTEIRVALGVALTEIESFAMGQHLEVFARSFRAASDALRGDFWSRRGGRGSPAGWDRGTTASWTAFRASGARRSRSASMRSSSRRHALRSIRRRRSSFRPRGESHGRAASHGWTYAVFTVV